MTTFSIFIAALISGSVLATVAVFARRPRGEAEADEVDRSNKAISVVVVLVCLAVVAIVTYVAWQAAQGEGIWA